MPELHHREGREGQEQVVSWSQEGCQGVEGTCRKPESGDLTFRPLVLFGELKFRRKIGHGKDHKFILKTAFNVYKSEQEVIEAVRDWHENGI